MLRQNLRTHTIQRNVPTEERYLDDWGDQLFRYTFTRLSLCGTLTICVAQQYSRVFACVGYAYVFEPAILPHVPPALLPYKSFPSHVNAYVFEPAILPHLPPALLRYKSLPSHVNADVFEPAIHTTSPSSAPAVQIPSITGECRCVHGTAYTLRTQHGHSSVCVCTAACTQLSLCVAHRLHV